MPGRGGPVHPPACPGCDNPRVLRPGKAIYHRHTKRIDLECRACGTVVSWSPDEKYVIRCVDCDRMFIFRFIAPRDKNYEQVNGETVTTYTCDACSAGEDPDEDDEAEADADDEPPEDDAAEGDDATTRPSRPTFEERMVRGSRVPLKDDLYPGRRR